jgi:hypothetical protein
MGGSRHTWEGGSRRGIRASSVPGLKTPIICFQHELKRVPITKQTKAAMWLQEEENNEFVRGLHWISLCNKGL